MIWLALTMAATDEPANDEAEARKLIWHLADGVRNMIGAFERKPYTCLRREQRTRE